MEVAFFLPLRPLCDEAIYLYCIVTSPVSTSSVPESEINRAGKEVGEYRIHFKLGYTRRGLVGNGSSVCCVWVGCRA